MVIVDKPKVSIVIPVYNAMPFLKKCLDSARNQSLEDLEIIVVNDGSTDGSGAYLDEVAELDSRIEVIHKDNAGVSSARNVGIAEARGEFVFFCDSDDWMEPNALEILYREGEESKADVVCADFFREANSSVVKHLFPKTFLTRNRKTISVLQQAVIYNGKLRCSTDSFDMILGLGGAVWHHLIRRSLIDAHGIKFPESVALLEDGIFMLSIFQFAQSVSYVPIPVYHYRVEVGSATHGYIPDFHEKALTTLAILKQYSERYRDESTFRDLINMRALSWLSKACQVNFCHPDNTASSSSRFKSFRRFANCDVLSEAIRDVPLNLYGDNGMRIRALILKMQLYKAFWLLEERKRKRHGLR